MDKFANVILIPQSREKDPCIGIKYIDSSLPPVAQNDEP